MRERKLRINYKPNIKHKSIKVIKSFDDYFRECIKNQIIPKDTPPYLKKALERALNIMSVLNMKNQLWIILLKSMLLMENQKLYHLNILKKKYLK